MRKRILVMTAVSAEQEAVLRGLKFNSRFDVMLAGVGPIAAAANTAKILATAPAITDAAYDLVISVGIGGGFPQKAPVESLVVATEIIAADVGVNTSQGFTSIDELGFGSTYIQADIGLVNKITEALLAAKLPVRTGPVLTVSTVTGTAAGAAELVKRVPEAAAEAMEGYGVAFAAKDQGVPIIEIRAISNQVGPRERDSWRIEEALNLLESASNILAEVC